VSRRRAGSDRSPRRGPRTEAPPSRAGAGSGRREPRLRDPAGARRALLRWYDAHRRDLPWRRTRDPYAIWISEAMLQQTRVETVIPYYARFLERFPDVAALASADRDEVLGVWAGLGYYSRARNLQAAAARMVEEHGGRVPADPEALRGLPGIGRYTAGAVASIAFDRPEPVLDGNVKRVLARLLGVRDDPRRAPVEAGLWATAARLAQGPRPGDLNQALMELGARVCTPRAPRCPDCPLARRCRARRAGDPEAIPPPTRRRAVPAVEAACALVLRRGRALAVRRPAEGLWAGLWELPGGEIEAGEPPARGLRRVLQERVGLEVEGLQPAGRVEHLLSHRRWRLHVYRAAAARGRVRRRGPPAHRWVPLARLGEIPQAVLTRKALDLLL